VLSDPLKAEYGAFELDADLVKPRVPGYEGGLGNPAVREDANEITQMMLQRLFTNGDNIVYPQLASNQAKLEALIAEARKHGYKVALHLADIPPERAALRVYERGMKPPDPVTGMKQILPPELPLSVGYGPQEVFMRIVSEGKVDACSYYYTNVKYGEPRIEVMRSQNKIPTGAKAADR